MGHSGDANSQAGKRTQAERIRDALAEQERIRNQLEAEQLPTTQVTTTNTAANDLASLKAQVEAVTGQNVTLKANLSMQDQISDLEKRLNAATVQLSAPSAQGKPQDDIKPNKLKMFFSFGKKAQKEVGTSTTADSASSQAILRDLQRKAQGMTKGLDLCFLIDCTYSMDDCLDAVKTKLAEIVEHILRTHDGALVRVAFVGYRDYGDKKPLLVHDFVTCENLPSLRSFVNPIEARGGGDLPEDVASGLRAVIGLSWNSSTRLVVHFCDAPGHGKFMKDPVYDYDDKYENEDPGGHQFRGLMQTLVSRKVDYYFAGITPYTNCMSSIMQECYDNSNNAQFKVMNWETAAESFVPLVLESVRSSMQTSAAYNRVMQGAQQKLNSASQASAGHTAQKNSVFHATVG